MSAHMHVGCVCLLFYFRAGVRSRKGERPALELLLDKLGDLIVLVLSFLILDRIRKGRDNPSPPTSGKGQE